MKLRILVGLTVMLVMVGCSSTHKISDFDVFWSDGKCIFHAKGMTIEQAQNLQKQWKFDNCDVEVDVSDNKGVKK